MSVCVSYESSSLPHIQAAAYKQLRSAPRTEATSQCSNQIWPAGGQEATVQQSRNESCVSDFLWDNKTYYTVNCVREEMEGGYF